jgi:hypothetical protein
VAEQIVTPRNSLSTESKPRLTMKFLGEAICSTTLSEICFQEFNIRLYDKNSESDYFFPSTKIRIFFSATLGIRIFFLEKDHNPHPLEVKVI